MSCLRYAGVARGGGGVGAVLISLWFLIRCFSRVAASRSFRAESRLARVYPSATAARSLDDEEHACLRAAFRLFRLAGACVNAIFEIGPCETAIKLCNLAGFSTLFISIHLRTFRAAAI